MYGALMSQARYLQVLERFNQEAANPVFALMCDMRNLGSASGRTCLIVMGTSLTFQNFSGFFAPDGYICIYVCICAPRSTRSLLSTVSGSGCRALRVAVDCRYGLSRVASTRSRTR